MGQYIKSLHLASFCPLTYGSSGVGSNDLIQMGSYTILAVLYASTEFGQVSYPDIFCFDTMLNLHFKVELLKHLTCLLSTW